MRFTGRPGRVGNLVKGEPPNRGWLSQVMLLQLDSCRVDQRVWRTKQSLLAMTFQIREEQTIHAQSLGAAILSSGWKQSIPISLHTSNTHRWINCPMHAFEEEKLTLSYSQLWPQPVISDLARYVHRCSSDMNVVRLTNQFLKISLFVDFLIYTHV